MILLIIFTFIFSYIKHIFGVIDVYRTFNTIFVENMFLSAFII